MNQTLNWVISNQQFRYLSKTGEFAPPAPEQTKAKE